MWIVALFLAGSPSANAGEGPPAAQVEVVPPSLTPDEVATRLAAKSSSFFVFDVNPREIYDEGHVPSAKWLAFDGVVAANLPADKGATLVFYCANVH